MATESFYGITLGTTLTNDFAPALNEKRGDFEYRKLLENDSFQYIFAKVNPDKKIIGIMLFKESKSDVDNEKFFRTAFLKLQEKYGKFICKERLNMDSSGKNEQCVTTYKNYKIDASYSHSSIWRSLYNIGTVRISYELIDGLDSLNKL